MSNKERYELSSKMSDLLGNISCNEDELEELESRIQQNTKKEHLKLGWIAPTGILISCLLTLLTANFKPRFGIASMYWEWFFIFVCILCILELIRQIILFCKYKKMMLDKKS